MTAVSFKFKQLELRVNWRIALLIGIGLMVLLRLGFWQLDRAQQKRLVMHQFEVLAQAEPANFSALNETALDELQTRKVRVRGHYLPDQHILIVNQRFRGMAGYEVITPFAATDGRLLLIGRGWVEAGHVATLAALDVSGEHELTGVLVRPPRQSFFKAQELKPGQWPLRLHHFDFESVRPLLATVPVPYVLRLEPGNAGVFQRHWPPVKIDPGVNTSYAAQWFGMALLLVVGSLLLSTNLPNLLGWRK